MSVIKRQQSCVYGQRGYIIEDVIYKCFVE
jgi:hypothetical protein